MGQRGSWLTSLFFTLSIAWQQGLGRSALATGVLVGPLALAGLGSGLVIAPNQDFVLGSVPKSQAGTAGGALITAQRLGAAIGIAVIGTVLFGGSSSSGSSGGGGQAKVMPMLTHSAQWATGLNLLFVIAALICAFFLPATLGAERAAENA